MAKIFGQAFWPGVSGFISCTYTVGHGLTPGMASLEVPLQHAHNIQPTGDLVITDGNGTIRVKRCKVTSLSFPGPGRMIIHIVDRRWMWAFGTISGNWNQFDPYPDPDSLPDGEFFTRVGPYQPGTYRTAEKLMADCFKAMNETNPFIDPVPTQPIPVQWNSEVPAQALASLADSIGYRVVYQPGFDRVVVCPVGEGVQLPQGIPIVEESSGMDLPHRPNELRLHGGPTLFHDWLLLEPVGLEKSGQVKTLDKLSYKPPGADGFAKGSGPPHFGGVVAGTDMTKDESIKLAQQHVWRTFRVKQADVQTGKAGPINVGGYGRVTDRKQLVLGNAIYGMSKDAAGQLQNEPPWVSGSVYFAASAFPNEAAQRIFAGVAFGNTTAASGILPVPFTIDSARGLVTFSRYMFKLVGEAGNARFEDPELRVFTSFQIRSAAGLVPVHFDVGGPTGSITDPLVPPEILRHPELVEIVRTNRNKKWQVVETFSNRSDLLPAADYYLRAANYKYELGPTTSKTYAGIVPIDPDGAISQVTYSVGGGRPPTTQASRNGEHSHYVPSYPERRKNETQKDFAAAFEAARAKKNAPAPARLEEQQLFPVRPGGGALG